MPEATLGEIYFIVIMMALVLVISIVSLYIFIKTYKKEMRERDAEKKRQESLNNDKVNSEDSK
jgi:uncharacterized membrane protein